MALSGPSPNMKGMNYANAPLEALGSFAEFKRFWDEASQPASVLA